MDGAPREIVHGTAVAVGGRAALIRGRSGAGKSDLALRCVAAAPSSMLPIAAMLVADDQVLVERMGASVVARAPETIRGKLEVRGLGIVAVPSIDEATLALVVELVSTSEIDRFPLTEQWTSLLGVRLPLMRLSAFEAAAAVKLLIALGAGPRVVEPSPAV